MLPKISTRTLALIGSRTQSVTVKSEGLPPEKGRLHYSDPGGLFFQPDGTLKECVIGTGDEIEISGAWYAVKATP